MTDVGNVVDLNTSEVVVHVLHDIIIFIKYVFAFLLAIGCSVVTTFIVKMLGYDSSSIAGGAGAAVAVFYLMYCDKKGDKGKSNT